MKKAFTIIELLVATALLAMLIAISGIVFSTAVKAHRTANAAAEVAAKLFALTDQLNRDFQGLRKDMPAAIWFEYDSNTGKRYDQIQFFADGMFESSKQWTYTNSSGTQVTETLSGNTARVYYGQANQVRINSSYQRTLYSAYNTSYSEARKRGTQMILGRRAHIQTANSMPTWGLFPVDPSDTTANFRTSFQQKFIPWLGGGSSGNYFGNDVFEYDNVSLSDWTNILADSTKANQNKYLDTCFNNTSGRPGIDLTASDGQSLHMVMVQGIGSFSIQLAYMSGGVLYWWPSQDPNGDGNTLDSDFTAMGATSFGYYMNFPVAPLWPNWTGSSNRSLLLTSDSSYPKAMKFTFTLYDSNGVFKDGKMFTHIVYFN